MAVYTKNFPALLRCVFSVSFHNPAGNLPETAGFAPVFQSSFPVRLPDSVKFPELYKILGFPHFWECGGACGENLTEMVFNNGFLSCQHPCGNLCG